MAECPDGRTNRGTRSQYRTGLPGLGLCKGFYPINLGKIMEAGQSSQISSSSSSSTNLISPCKGTHTLTVREYEQTIDELKKENFNLKLKLYLCDETHLKTCRDKDSSTTANDEMVQVIVHLSSESETLRAELKEKEKLLQDALERAEKLESDFKELEKINADLQSELTSFSELPSKEEILLLLEEKESFVNTVESLENLIKEKEEEIDTLNQKIEILANENTHLEEKIKKRSVAIQGFVYKSYKEKEMLPDEFRNIVISALQAAKNKNKSDLAVSLKTLTSALNKILSASDQSQSEEKENIESPKAKCLEEVAEKSAGSSISSHTESSSHMAQIQDLKVLSERNLSDTKQAKILDSFAHQPYITEEMVHRSTVHIPEKDRIDFCDISPSTEENLISFTERLSLQTCSASKPNLTEIKTLSSVPEKDTLEPHQLVNILNENKQLKHDLEEKLTIINDLRATCKELEEMKALQATESDAFKASQKHCISTQTKIAGSNLLDEYEVIKLQRDVKLSDDVEELREDILLLLLAIEEKNKELSEMKESLTVVQKDMKRALSTTSTFDTDFYLHERNELHERLALSCSVNEELIRHLKNLEKFMEDLLQHKFDSSLESIVDKSDFMSSVSRCLNESLKLSRTLSDHLSICEGSKLFEECESFTHKNTSYSEEKDLAYLGLDRLSMLEQQTSYFGSRKFEECLTYVQKNNLNIGKESDSSQLCWRCWQQLNPPINQSEVSHLMQNNSVNKPIGYQSSDSDIWSEPDRNVSMQRIGISLQNSPVSTKSPRKLRQRDKRMSSKISSKEDTSSSGCQQTFKKRQGSASRRLFVKEDAKTQDFALDNFYFLIAEKYSKLKSLLDDLGNLKEGKLSDDGWVRLNRLVFAVGETLQKLHFAQENAKTSSVCGKCVMLELFSSLKASHVEADFFINGASSEQKILQEFSKELCLLKEACKEPFSVLYESIKKSTGTQSDILTESEQIEELKTVINNLNASNKELNENFEKINCLFSKEKEELISIKAENSDLLNKIDNLKIDLLDMKYKEKELNAKNEKLLKELTDVNKSNSELNIALKDLEQKKKECTIALDQLTSELEKKRLDFIDMNKKCLNYEKELNEQIHMRENCENKLKTLESESLNEKNYLLRKIDDLNSEKKYSIQEMKAIQEEKLALEKETAVINDRLQSKNNELLSLKKTIDKIQSIKETQNDIKNESVSKEKIIFDSVKAENYRLLNEINHLKEELLDMKYKEKELSFENKNLLEKMNDVNKNYSELNHAFKDLKQKMEESGSAADQLRSELQKNKLDLIYMNKKCAEYERILDEQMQIKEKYENKLKSLETCSASEKEKHLNQLGAVNSEKNQYVQELKNIKAKILVLEKENAVINNNLHSKDFELSSLRKTIEELQNDKEALISDNETVKRLFSESKETYESIETENCKLLNQIKQLKEELSHMENKEKEISLKNKKLVEQLIQLGKNNSDMSNTLKSLEQKRKESSVDLDQLTAELQKCKSDLIHMNEKCIEYEKQLNEEKHMRQNSEFKLKNLESESVSEKNYYSCKINDLDTERNHYIQELKTLQEQKLALEKENAVINDRLQSKNNELLSLKETIEKLQSVKESQNDIENESSSKEKIIFESIKAENFRLLNEINHLKENLLDQKYKEKELSFQNKKLIEELDLINKNYSEVNASLKNVKEKYNKTSSIANQLQDELQKSKSDLSDMNKKLMEYEEKLNEQIQKKETVENKLKTVELESLAEKENYMYQLNALTAEKNSFEQKLKEIKMENLKLLNQKNNAEEELSTVKNKERELCLKNEKLIGELNEVNKSNSKLNNTLKFLEQKSNDSNNEFNNLTAELQKNKSDLIHLTQKCLVYEKKLNEQSHLKEKYENDLKTQESNLIKEKNYYLSQINNLNVEKDNYLHELQSVQEKKIVLEKEIIAINNRLESKNNEISSLQKTIKELQKAKEELDSNCEKLQNKLVDSQECQTNLQEKCKKYEEAILKYKESESEYFQKLKQLEAKSKIEEKKLNEISTLTKDREDVLQKLKSEKEQNKRLKAENIKLSEDCSKSSQQSSVLKQRIEFFENALLSSNKECESLNKDLKCLRNTLQNLESKCLMYEKQLVATAGMKENLTECLLNINNEFSIQRQKLNEMCKMYGNDDSVVWDETSFTKFMPVIDEDNISKLCENIVSETKKLSQSVDMLFYILKSYHLRSMETEITEKTNHIKDNLDKKIELYKTEIENLRLQNDQLQKSVFEKEKSIQNNAYEVKLLKERLQKSQKEIDRENQLIQKKDDEITMLQERIFNLQTYVNSIITDKKILLEKTESIIKPESFDSSNNQLPSKIVSTDTKICQTDECEGFSQSIDESFTSVSSLESGKCHYCEKYWKKCYSLQTKLILCQKHIEVLEKDKNDLKERLLQQLESKKDVVVRSDTSVSKLSELESKLEKKKLFISELKSELLKTCNALIDKEKEVDDLKQNLAECKIKYQHGVDVSKTHTAEILNSVDANVKTLQNHKWKLIQTIFDIQRKFYEKKGIHLNYFNRFKEHVNNLYSLQLIPSMSKSQSMPLLRSHALKEQYEQGNEKVKRLADLELDIECLQNLKIFLNRFLVPCVFQTTEMSDKETKMQQQAISCDSLSLTSETGNLKESKHEITDILNMSLPEAFIMADRGKTLSIDDIAGIISQHLDSMQKFLESVSKTNWLEILNVFKDSVDKVPVKTLLLKIFQEITSLHEKADKLFNFNTDLKSCDLVSSIKVPPTTTKLDTSDRESIMSEETIAISRTESPLSFEDICPIKLPHPETLQLEENSLKPTSARNRITVIEPYSANIAAVEGSCDSVCQRSHYSSPDLGIESDPNHDSSAPEHKEDGTSEFPFKPQQIKTAFTNVESAGRWQGPKFGDTCYAVGTLPHFELLKQEIKESLVAIKSVLSRTGDGLHHIAKYTSPRKNLEYNTLKSIKDTCVHMEVCLREANNLVGKFWTAPCPTEKEWKMLKEENQKLSENLASLRILVEKQENEFKTAIGKLERAQAVKDNIEKKISKKLVKTKKLIRQAELRLLETRCQNFPPVPKYPSEQAQTDAH